MSRKQRPHLHVVLSTTSTFNVSKIIQQHLIVFSVTLFSARFEMCNNSRYRQHQELLLIPPPKKKPKKQKKPQKGQKHRFWKKNLQITLHLLSKVWKCGTQDSSMHQSKLKNPMKDTNYYTKTTLNKCTKKISSFLIVLSISPFKIRKNTLHFQYKNNLINLHNLTWYFFILVMVLIIIFLTVIVYANIAVMSKNRTTPLHSNRDY